MSNLSTFLTGGGYGLREVLTSSGTWNWTTAGKPRKVFVRMIAGAGGNTEGSGSGTATAGGNTVWDTGAVVSTTTCTGGGASTNSAVGSGTGNHSEGQYISNGNTRDSRLGHFGSVQGQKQSSAIYTGAGGEFKEFQYVPTGNVDYTIGAGGSEAATGMGNGYPGAIELYY